MQTPSERSTCRPAAGPNWVRFARFTPRPSHAPDESSRFPYTPVHPNLASFCTISSITRLRRGEIGFVLHNSALRRLGVPVRHLPPAGRNWVRFARFTPRPRHGGRGDGLCPYTPVHLSLASFCIISSVTRLRRAEIGFVLHNSALRRLGVPARHLSIRNHVIPDPDPGPQSARCHCEGQRDAAISGPPAPLA
jgi:hypothetical protein